MLHSTGGPRLAITLFIRSRPGATRDEIVDHLMNSRDYGEREHCVTVVTRNLREMEKDHQVSVNTNGYHILSKVKFVIREEEVWSSWFFVASVGLAITFFAYAFESASFNISTAFTLLFILIIILKILEDFWQTTPW